MTRLWALLSFTVAQQQASWRTEVSREASISDRVEFETFDFSGEIRDVFWCGSTNEELLVHSTDGSIYWSSDRGSSWHKMREYMESLVTQSMVGKISLML
jgi:hypothetical protein